MKKIFSIVALVGIGFTTFGQTIKIAPEFGGVYQTMNQKFYGEKRETQYQLGVRIGGVVDIGFSNNFSIQPGAFIQTNSGSESYFEEYYSTGAGLPTSTHDRRNYNVTSVQIPVYFLYKTGKEYDDPHFFFGAAPYVGINIGGRFKQEYTNTLNGVGITKKYDHHIRIGNERKDDMRRVDLGLQGTVGYETSFGLYFRAFYGVGLLNTFPNADSNSKFQNHGGGLSVGFLFRASQRKPWEI